MDTIIKYFILVVFLFTACRTTEFYHAEGYNFSDDLVLKKDSSFVQYVKRYNFVDTFYGNWNKQKDTLVLNFTKPEIIDPRNPKNRVEEHFASNKDSITFYFYFNDTLTVGFPVHIILNNAQDKYPKTYLKGIMQMQKNKTIKNIMAYTLGGSLYHNVKDTTTNLFYIYLYNDTFLPSITRSNIINKWFLSKNRLYPIDRNTNEINKTEDYYLKRNFIFHK